MAADLKTYVIASEKPWHSSLFENLKNTIPGNWVLIRERNALTEETIRKISPTTIFFPHWSYIIPEALYSQYECVVFHMTDLPFGRGGSPLQNLIVRGYKETKLSALRVQKGLDTGPVYLKKDLLLEGTAMDILLRASELMPGMIREIIMDALVPVPQQGEPVLFTRRQKRDGDLACLTSLEEAFDYIRMLDAEGYPPAFLETADLVFEFTDASRQEGGASINANVRIFKK